MSQQRDWLPASRTGILAMTRERIQYLTGGRHTINLWNFVTGKTPHPGGAGVQEEKPAPHADIIDLLQEGAK